MRGIYSSDGLRECIHLLHAIGGLQLQQADPSVPFGSAHALVQSTAIQGLGLSAIALKEASLASRQAGAERLFTHSPVHFRIFSDEMYLYSRFGISSIEIHLC